MKVSAPLVRGLILKLVLGSILIIATVTAVGYTVVYSRAERDGLNRLADYVAERARFESAIFLRTEAALRTFADAFLDHYQDPQILADPDPAFEDAFFRDQYGATRLSRRYFDGITDAGGLHLSGVSAFIGDDETVLSADFRRRLLLAVKLVGRYGPAWSDIGLHASFPENGVVLYLPDEAWGLKARHDLRMNQGSVIASTLQANNPDRKPVWTGLYFDLTVKRWSITHELPVDLDGRHVVNPSADVLLTDLMRRVVDERMPGTANFIFSRQGYVVANSRTLTEEHHAKGQIAVDEVDDPVVRSLYAALEGAMAGPPTHRRDGPKGVWVTEVPGRAAYVAVTALDGPDWLFAVSYPKALLSPAAHRAAGVLVGLGAGIFLFVTLVMVVVLTRDVSRPLTQLAAAAEKVGDGAYETVAGPRYPLPEDVPNEIGLLAREFRSMTRRVRDANRDLERMVAARTRELEDANRKLTALSLIDGLTGARNRRAFDHDLAAACRAGVPFALALLDVDHFKAFNDTQGHQKGDEVLQAIVAAFETAGGTAGDGIYRYGGEELAVLMTGVDGAQAQARTRRLVEAVAALDIPHPASLFGRVSISGGVAVTEDREAVPAEVIRRADEKLYAAKNGGRNRFVA